MFSKSYCPYCKRAQARLNKFLGEYKHPQDSKSKGVREEDQPYKVYEIDLGMHLALPVSIHLTLWFC